MDDGRTVAVKLSSEEDIKCPVDAISIPINSTPKDIIEILKSISGNG